MDLPVKIEFSNNRYIKYTYDAAGTKWSKQVADNSKQVKTEYINGFQYKAGKLLFFPTAEGYVKAVYEDTGNSPAAYRYVYTYKDHLGNNRLSYTLNPVTNKVDILEENNYYPFGLTHPYNNTKRELKFDTAGNLQIMQVTEKELGFKYYYQEQERQNELNLNWDSFKYRNYDYAIGRFMSIDPLAEKYAYNSTYAFQENKMGLGTELEGNELQLLPWLTADVVAHPNGVGAHALGFTQGVINSVKGAYNAVTNPVQTIKGIGNMMVAGAANMNPAQMLTMDNTLGTDSFGTSMSMTQSVVNGVDAVVNGNGLERGEILGQISGTIALGEGAGAALKGASTLIKANRTTKVYRVFGGDAKANGFSWTPKNPKTVSNFRDVAGLPSGGESGSMNTAEFLIKGTVKNKNIIKKRAALPLDGNKGGLPEYIIDPKNVKNKNITKFN